MMVSKSGISFSKGPFSGSMFVLGGVNVCVQVGKRTNSIGHFRSLIYLNRLTVKEPAKWLGG